MTNIWLCLIFVLLVLIKTKKSADFEQFNKESHSMQAKGIVNHLFCY